MKSIPEEVQEDLGQIIELARLRAAQEMEAEAAAAGVLTDSQLDQFEKELIEKAAPNEKFFPVAVMLMRHIRAMRD